MLKCCHLILKLNSSAENTAAQSSALTEIYKQHECTLKMVDMIACLIACVIKFF